jgi:hypothetical protein
MIDPIIIETMRTRNTGKETRLLVFKQLSMLWVAKYGPFVFSEQTFIFCSLSRRSKAVLKRRLMQLPS